MFDSSWAHGGRGRKDRISRRGFLRSSHLTLLQANKITTCGVDMLVAELVGPQGSPTQDPRDMLVADNVLLRQSMLDRDLDLLDRGNGACRFLVRRFQVT